MRKNTDIRLQKAYIVGNWHRITKFITTDLLRFLKLLCVQKNFFKSSKKIQL